MARAPKMQLPLEDSVVGTLGLMRRLLGDAETIRELLGAWRLHPTASRREWRPGPFRLWRVCGRTGPA